MTILPSNLSHIQSSNTSLDCSMIRTVAIHTAFLICLLHYYTCSVLLQLQIWDTAGQERFRTITQSYYRSANGVIIAYDITKRHTFDNVRRWLDDVKKYAAPNITQILIGINIATIAHSKLVDLILAEIRSWFCLH